LQWQAFKKEVLLLQDASVPHLHTSKQKTKTREEYFCGTCSMNDSDEEPDSDEERARHEE